MAHCTFFSYLLSGQKLRLQFIYCTLNHAGFVGAGHARDQSMGRGHGPVTTLHLLQLIADCLLLVLLHGCYFRRNMYKPKISM
jgi:hypothetical protein